MLLCEIKIVCLFVCIQFCVERLDRIGFKHYSCLEKAQNLQGSNWTSKKKYTCTNNFGTISLQFTEPDLVDLPLLILSHLVSLRKQYQLLPIFWPWLNTRFWHEVSPHVWYAIVPITMVFISNNIYPSLAPFV